MCCLQPQGTVPDLWGLGEGDTMDSVIAGRTVECKCHRRVALEVFVAHYLGCPAIPQEHRRLFALAYRALSRNPEASLRALAERNWTNTFKN